MRITSARPWTTADPAPAEIDRTLKAVTQGVEIFEETFEKLEQATNMTVKEKLESELKVRLSWC